MSLEDKMLDLLKDHAPKGEFEADRKKSCKAKYYFKRPESNVYDQKAFEIYKNQIGGGDGKELTPIKETGLAHFCSLRSSSAFLFNLLGDSTGSVKIIDNRFDLPKGDYSLEFEKKLQGIGTSNIDAYLRHFSSGPEDKETLILVESKMLEFLTPDYTISKSYLNQEKYKGIDPRISQVFLKVFSLITDVSQPAIDGYRCPLKKEFQTQFDVFQLLKHSLGFISQYSKGAIKKADAVTLLNIFYEMNNPSLLGEYEKEYSSILSKEKESNAFIGFDWIAELYHSYGLSFRFLGLNQNILINEITEVSPAKKAYIEKRYSFAC